MMTRDGLRCLAAAFAISATLVFGVARGEDVLTIGSGSAPSGGAAQVPVYVRDISATPLGTDAGTGNRIQGIAFKVTCSPPAAVASMSFSRAGVLQPLTPLYEANPLSTNGVAYVGSFAETTNPIPFVLDAGAPGDRVGTLLVTFSASATADTVVTLTIDSATATLSNQAGTVGEKVADSSLSVVNGTATVDHATTTTVLESSSNPSTEGQNVTFIAAVTSGTAGTITGTVTFNAGATTLGTASVSGGQATYSTAMLAEGTHSITAAYGGDTGYLPSTSAALSQVVNPATFAAPLGLVATAVTTGRVDVSWLPVTNANHYEVWRSTNNQAYAHLFPDPTAASFTDSGVTAGNTYLYRVRAVDAGSATSAFSALDFATTIFFADDPLVAQSTIIQARHLRELRQAVNAFRAAAALGALSFADPAGAPIAAVDITDLRSGLNAARSQLLLGNITFTDSTLTPSSSIVKASHFQEIRQAVK